MSRSWVDIDLDAIAHNIAVLRDLAGHAEICAVVKANAYGHGAVTIARAALAAGASRLAVAQVDEGVQLRYAGIEEPIWLFSEPSPDEFMTVEALALMPSIYSEAALAAADAAGIAGSGPIGVHLTVDTGMHRVGCRPDEAVDLARRIESARGVYLESVWTHFATADEPGNPTADAQIDLFDQVLDNLEEAGVRVPLVHLANSAGAIDHPRARRDVVRTGIAMYGLPPSPQMTEAQSAGLASLRPVLSWKSAVSFVKRLEPGDRVSYGHRTEIDHPLTAATVPVGYADGYRRQLWAAEPSILIGGVPRRILGVVTMDQLVVDCGDDPVAVGDEVVLLGEQAGPNGTAVTTADDLAERLGTINYEIVCGIADRSERRPYRSGQP